MQVLQLLAAREASAPDLGAAPAGALRPARGSAGGSARLVGAGGSGQPAARTDSQELIL